jgi:hypothetical protein
MWRNLIAFARRRLSYRVAFENEKICLHHVLLSHYVLVPLHGERKKTLDGTGELSRKNTLRRIGDGVHKESW